MGGWLVRCIYKVDKIDKTDWDDNLKKNDCSITRGNKLFFIIDTNANKRKHIS